MNTTTRVLAILSAGTLLAGLGTGAAQASADEPQGSIDTIGIVPQMLGASVASTGLPAGSLVGNKCVGIIPPMPLPSTITTTVGWAGDPQGTANFRFETGGWGGDIDLDMTWRNVDTGASGEFSETVSNSYMGGEHAVVTGRGTVEWEITRAVGRFSGEPTLSIDPRWPFTTCSGVAEI